MPYQVVPQEVVDELGPALSTNENTGRVMAEQLCRSAAGDVIMKLQAGEELTAIERVQLPPLMSGNSWDTIAERIRLVDKEG